MYKNGEIYINMKDNVVGILKKDGKQTPIKVPKGKSKNKLLPFLEEVSKDEKKSEEG